MKTKQQLDAARHTLCERMLEPKTKEQTLLLIGMLNALVWAADGHPETCRTIQRVLDGEPFGDPFNN